MRRSNTMKLVEFKRERPDSDNISEEKASISNLQTNTGTSIEAVSNKSEEQAGARAFGEQAGASAFAGEAGASAFAEEAGASGFTEETGASGFTYEDDDSTFAEEAGASEFTDEDDASMYAEETGGPFAEVFDFIPLLKRAGFSRDVIEQLVERARRRVSEFQGRGIIFSEQPGALKLTRMYKDFPRLSLPAYVDFGKLFSIAQKYIEFRGIIRIILLINDAMYRLKKSEQRRIVSTVVKIEEYIHELAELADSPYDPKEIDELFCRLGCHLDHICTILQKSKVQRFSPFLVFGFDVFPSQKRRRLVLREKDYEVDANFLRGIGTTQTYLRTSLDTKYLGEISRNHPEFAPSIKTIFGVYAAMKYLPYETQVIVFENLHSLQKTIKELVLCKKYLDVETFERYAPTLIGKISDSFSVLLNNLSKNIVPPEKKRIILCEPCEPVSKFVKNVNIKPEQLEREPLNREEAIRRSVDYANVGIAQANLDNLESFFHHLAARKGVDFKHTLEESRINWAGIARQYKEYSDKARKDLTQLGIWKDNFFWRLVEAEEIMAEARTFCDRIRDIRFTGNETLSDSIALGGELDLLSTEAEDYLTSLIELIGHFTKDWSEYEKVSKRIRRSRFRFLTERFIMW